VRTVNALGIQDHLEKYNSVWERVWKSVHTLATSPDTIQYRLGQAHLDLWPLHEREFPPESRDKFTKLMEDLQARYVPSPTGNCRLDVSDDEGRELAKRIVELCDSIDSLRIVNGKLS
jgi:hypothetical protein